MRYDNNRIKIKKKIIIPDTCVHLSISAINTTIISESVNVQSLVCISLTVAHQLLFFLIHCNTLNTHRQVPLVVSVVLYLIKLFNLRSLQVFRSYVKLYIVMHNSLTTVSIKNDRNTQPLSLNVQTYELYRINTTTMHSAILLYNIVVFAIHVTSQTTSNSQLPSGYFYAPSLELIQNFR